MDQSAHLSDLLSPLAATAAGRVTEYDGTTPTTVIAGLPVAFDADAESGGGERSGEQPDAGEVAWRFSAETRTPSRPRTASPDSGELLGSKFELDGEVADVTVVARCVAGAAASTSGSLEVRFDGWSTDVFTLMPAGLYAGNRFRVLKSGYSPIPDYFDEHPPVTVSDVPRLSSGDGPSRVELRSGDLAFPAFCAWFPAIERALLILTCERTAKGWVGFDLQESADRRSASLRIMTPAMREKVKYTICDLSVPSDDEAVHWAAGDEVRLDLTVASVPCTRLPDLYYALYKLRDSVTKPGPRKHELPFSEAFALIEKKYNESEQWNEADGYYGVGMREVASQDWQVGWVGGGMSSLPLLADGTDLSRDRARRTIDFMTGRGQDTGGLYYGFHHHGVFSHSVENWLHRYLEQGGSEDDKTGRMLAKHRHGHLIRKTTDAVYFLAKHIMLLQRRGEPAPVGWTESLRQSAGAIAQIWRRHGQLGQFVDGKTLDIAIGGTTSGASGAGALALASTVLGDPQLLSTAQEIGEAHYQAFAGDGYTNGGPGDMLQNPDSESAYALVASLVTLWETTDDHKWMGRAQEVCWYALTWTMNYDFPFPKDSTFGKLDMRTTGSTFANTQNKHSAPGLCTLSGQSLFKIYRATGDVRLLEIIGDMTHNITQYLSREDKPILAKSAGKYMPPGWMNERVETSDWLEPLGEIFYGPCWCEVSCLLTYSEIPGIYVQPDTGVLAVFDHVEVGTEGKGQELTLVVTNPTKFLSRVKVLVESSTEMAHPLGENYLADAPQVEVAPGTTVRYRVSG